MLCPLLLKLITCSVLLSEASFVSSTTFYKEKTIKQHISRPVLPSKPFISVWNIETGPCKSKYGVDIDLTDFDIVCNKDQMQNGDKMMIFYSSKFGHYPHFDLDGRPIYGGLPQLGNLTSHLEKCRDDIVNFIPDSKFSGLSVIDWEAWTPLWSNMGWGERKKYQLESIAKVQFEHPDWSDDQIEQKAIDEYETATKNYILETLKLCKKLRPNAYWGFYLYPDCYNYDKNKQDLSCPQRQILRDDEIQWMFDESTALYPSTYLGIWFKNQSRARSFVGHRIKEALRVDANRPGNVSVPIYAYNNLVYRKTRTFLTFKDVVDSSGLAAVLGSSGVVLWASHMHDNKSFCVELNNYVTRTLGPFLKLASDAASECSVLLCSGNGRCSLNQEVNNEKPGKRAPYKMIQFLRLVLKEEKNLDRFIRCHCYIGWTGNSCQQKLY